MASHASRPLARQINSTYAITKTFTRVSIMQQGLHNLQALNSLPQVYCKLQHCMLSAL